MRKILAYLSIIYEGDWNKIYQSIIDKEQIDQNKMNIVLSELKVDYITIIDNNYPESLKHIYKPPFVIFYKGNLELLNNNFKKISIIGSRENSDYGKDCTNMLCKELLLKDENIVIVSGLAKGIDSIAHTECLKQNGKTIAVIGNGLDITYPKCNKDLYESISLNGLIISEYPNGVIPKKEHFPIRNRLIAGISDGICVIEAKVKSGTMNTVSYALEEGKPIFCVPDRCFNESGCNKLIKEGAKLIENANDILEDLY